MHNEQNSVPTWQIIITVFLSMLFLVLLALGIFDNRAASAGGGQSAIAEESASGSEGTGENPDSEDTGTDTDETVQPQDDTGTDTDETVQPQDDTDGSSQKMVVHVKPTAIPDEYLSYNDHTYAFYDASRYNFSSYDEVAEFCRTQGGHLAVINDYAENAFLFDALRNREKTAFFGYSDEDEEGVWVWSDGTSDFTNWTTFGDWDLPDNGKEWGGDEDYAEFNYEKDKAGIPNDGTWNDAPFMENTTFFICEWDYPVEL